MYVRKNIVESEMSERYVRGHVLREISSKGLLQTFNTDRQELPAIFKS